MKSEKINTFKDFYAEVKGSEQAIYKVWKRWM